MHEDQEDELELETPLMKEHVETQTNEVELSCDEDFPESDESSQPLSMETNLESSQSSEQVATQPANRRQPAKVTEVNIPTR